MNRQELKPKEYQLPAQSTLEMLSKLAIVAIIIIIPFAIYNFFIQNYILGITAIIIVGIFTYIAWSSTQHNTYHPKLIFWFLTPIFIFFIAVIVFIQGIPGVLWSYSALLGFYCMLPEKKAYVANGILLLIVIPITFLKIDLYIAFRAVASLLLVYIFAGIFTYVINKQQRKLQELAITDPLTSLLNRATLEDTLEQAIEQHRRAAIPMSIAIFDLDHFKKVNDQYGHDQGDRVLQKIAQVLLNRCRKVDKVFRLGGEEFLVFLYNTSQKDALLIAEELRGLIENTKINSLCITASAGLATLKENENWREWIKRADEKQYHAKLLGRNRVTA